MKKLTSVLMIMSLFVQVGWGDLSQANFWKERNTKREALLASLGQAASFLDPLNPTPRVTHLPRISNAFSKKSDPWSLRNKMLIQSNALHKLMQAIPQNNGIIQEFFDSGKKQGLAVALIQDIHMNSEAQENIAQILEALPQFLTKKDPVLVGVEGVDEEFNFDEFRKLQDNKILKDVATHFLKENRIAAPSFVGIIKESLPVVFSGIETKTDYDANVKALLGAQKVSPHKKDRLSKAQLYLDKTKAIELNKTLLEWDQVQSAYRSERFSLGEYVSLMRKRSQASLNPILQQFLLAYNLENSLDLRKVEQERNSVLKVLIERLTGEEIKELLNFSLAYKSGDLSHGDFYEQLNAKFALHNISLKKSPHFDKYIRYVLVVEGIQVGSLLNALRKQEEAITDSLCQNQREKDLMQESRQLHLMARLLDFALTPEEWEEYQQTKNVIARNEATKQSHKSINEIATSRLRRARDDMRHFEEFYRLADKRSQNFVENLLTKLSTGRHANSAALLVGGFHTALVTKYLKEKGLAYVVVRPHITKLSGQNGTEYLSLFSREKTPLDKLFEGDKLFLAPNTLAAGTSKGLSPARLIQSLTRILTALSGRTVKGVLVTLEGGYKAIEDGSSISAISRENNSRPNANIISDRIQIPGYPPIEYLEKRQNRDFFDFTIAPLFELAGLPGLPLIIMNFMNAPSAILYGSVLFSFLHIIIGVGFWLSAKFLGHAPRIELSQIFGPQRFLIRTAVALGINVITLVPMIQSSFVTIANLNFVLLFGLVFITAYSLHSMANQFLPVSLRLSLTPSNIHYEQFETFFDETIQKHGLRPVLEQIEAKKVSHFYLRYLLTPTKKMTDQSALEEAAQYLTRETDLLNPDMSWDDRENLLNLFIAVISRMDQNFVEDRQMALKKIMDIFNGDDKHWIYLIFNNLAELAISGVDKDLRKEVIGAVIDRITRIDEVDPSYDLGHVRQKFISPVLQSDQSEEFWVSVGTKLVDELDSAQGEMKATLVFAMGYLLVKLPPSNYRDKIKNLLIASLEDEEKIVRDYAHHILKFQLKNIPDEKIKDDFTSALAIQLDHKLEDIRQHAADLLNQSLRFPPLNLIQETAVRKLIEKIDPATEDSFELVKVYSLYTLRDKGPLLPLTNSPDDLKIKALQALSSIVEQRGALRRVDALQALGAIAVTLPQGRLRESSLRTLIRCLGERGELGKEASRQLRTIFQEEDREGLAGEIIKTMAQVIENSEDHYWADYIETLGTLVGTSHRGKNQTTGLRILVDHVVWDHGNEFSDVPHKSGRVLFAALQKLNNVKLNDYVIARLTQGLSTDKKEVKVQILSCFGKILTLRQQEAVRGQKLLPFVIKWKHAMALKKTFLTRILAAVVLIVSFILFIFFTLFPPKDPLKTEAALTISQSLQHPDERVRKTAASAIQDLFSIPQENSFKKAISLRVLKGLQENALDRQYPIETALKAIYPEYNVRYSGVEYVILEIIDKQIDPEIRTSCLIGLFFLAEAESGNRNMGGWESSQPNEVTTLIESIEKIKDENITGPVLERIISTLAHENPLVRATAAEILGEILPSYPNAHLVEGGVEALLNSINPPTEDDLRPALECIKALGLILETAKIQTRLADAVVEKLSPYAERSHYYADLIKYSARALHQIFVGSSDKSLRAKILPVILDAIIYKVGFSDYEPLLSLLDSLSHEEREVFAHLVRPMISDTQLLSIPSRNEIVGILIVKSIIAPDDIPDLDLGLENILFSDGGHSNSNAYPFAKGVLSTLPNPTFSSLPEPLNLDEVSFVERETTVNELLSELNVEDQNEVQPLGRTLRFKTRDGKTVAIKLLKIDEEETVLAREGLLLNYLNRHQVTLGLKGRFPRAMVQQQRPVVFAFKEEFSGAIGEAISKIEGGESGAKSQIQINPKRKALVYISEDATYFDYLSRPDLAEDQYWESLERNLHDLFTLARFGLLHTSLIDIFHNLNTARPDGGRYLWMVDIIFDMHRHGAGRLHDYLDSVRYSNMRVSGMADLADVKTISQIDGNPSEHVPHLLNIKWKFENKSANFFLTNVLGDYLLASILMMGPRLKSKEDEYWKDENAMKELGARLQHAFAVATAAFLGIREEEAKALVLTNGDYKRLARQMAFYMTKAYMPYVDPQKGASGRMQEFPKGIYRDGARVEFDQFRDMTWDRHIGWIGHHNDLRGALGPVNGPMPIQEIVEINYRLIPQMLIRLSERKAVQANAASLFYALTGWGLVGLFWLLIEGPGLVIILNVISQSSWGQLFLMSLGSSDVILSPVLKLAFLILFVLIHPVLEQLRAYLGRGQPHTLQSAVRFAFPRLVILLPYLLVTSPFSLLFIAVFAIHILYDVNEIAPSLIRQQSLKFAKRSVVKARESGNLDLGLLVATLNQLVPIEKLGVHDLVSFQEAAIVSLSHEIQADQNVELNLALIHQILKGENRIVSEGDLGSVDMVIQIMAEDERDVTTKVDSTLASLPPSSQAVFYVGNKITEKSLNWLREKFGSRVQFVRYREDINLSPDGVKSLSQKPLRSVKVLISKNADLSSYTRLTLLQLESSSLLQGLYLLLENASKLAMEVRVKDLDNIARITRYISTQA